jgi:hypothetical protein
MLPDGRPFLAIKLIRGQTLAEHLATVNMDWVAAPAQPVNPLSAVAGRERISRKVLRKLYDCVFWRFNLLFWRFDSLIKSPTMSEITAGNPPELLRLLGLFERVCQTMAYSHSRNVIHRDLKPVNIMIGEFGEVQVMDWGLAKSLAEPSDSPAPEANHLANPHAPGVADEDFLVRTLAGRPIGTPAYMPPEQARGELERIDKRSDVFALGAILCELLTGKPPFVGPSAEALAQAKAGNLEAALDRLSTSRVEKELAALARTCLAAEPADRPADAGVVSNAVSAYLEGLSDRLKQADRRQAAELGRAREDLSALGWIAMALLTIAFVLGWAWVNGFLRRRPEPPAPTVIHPTFDEIEVNMLRTKLREGGPSGERLANLPDEVLLRLLDGELTGADVVIIQVLQDRLAKREAKKPGSAGAERPGPDKSGP